jgi:hypothetical protein
VPDARAAHAGVDLHVHLGAAVAAADQSGEGLGLAPASSR